MEIGHRTCTFVMERKRLDFEGMVSTFISFVNLTLPYQAPPMQLHMPLSCLPPFLQSSSSPPFAHVSRPHPWQSFPRTNRFHHHRPASKHNLIGLLARYDQH